MPIRNIESTLSDREYIAALEAELRELRQFMERAQQDISNLYQQVR